MNFLEKVQNALEDRVLTTTRDMSADMTESDQDVIDMFTTAGRYVVIIRNCKTVWELIKMVESGDFGQYGLFPDDDDFMLEWLEAEIIGKKM